MAISKPRSLSGRLVREAEEHLSRSDAVMARLVGKHGSCVLGREPSRPFHALAVSIIGQQLSARAARTIVNRVSEIVPMPLAADAVLSVSPERLRSAGLSGAKAHYILELAARVADGRLNMEQMARQSDEDVVSALTELPGIGRWTAEMFLIFGLRRPDVLSLGDAGLQRAARALYAQGREQARLLETVGTAWIPYRSVASWYLWRHLDSAP